MTVETVQHFTLTAEEVEAFRLASLVLADIAVKSDDAVLSRQAKNCLMAINDLGNSIGYVLTN